MNAFLKTYDSSTLERISRHILYWGSWVVFFVTANSIMSKVFTLPQWIIFEFIVLPIKIGCSYTIAYWVMPRFLFRKQYASFFVLSFLVFLNFSYLLLFMYRDVIYPHILQYPIYTTFYHDAVYWCLELFYISSLIVGVKFFQNLLKQQKLSHELRQEKIKTELKFLKNQVQPHFLFNTLNNLYSIVLSGDKHSAGSIVKLSDMLSYMLYESEDDFVQLEKELTHLDNYIDLEKLRYNRKLTLEYERPTLSTGLLIAPQLLIPFVENAFKHGPAKEEGQSFIFIRISLVENTLKLRIKNTYNESQMDASIQSGIGLNNVKKRLDLIYKDQYRLDIKKEECYQVDLSLNLSYQKMQ